MVLNSEYNIGDFVYLKTDTEQLKRMITGYSVRKDTILYYLSQGVTETTHYGIEINNDIDVIIKTS